MSKTPRNILQTSRTMLESSIDILNISRPNLKIAINILRASNNFAKIHRILFCNKEYFKNIKRFRKHQDILKTSRYWEIEISKIYFENIRKSFENRRKYFENSKKCFEHIKKYFEHQEIFENSKKYLKTHKELFFSLIENCLAHFRQIV